MTIKFNGDFRLEPAKKFAGQISEFSQEISGFFGQRVFFWGPKSKIQ